MNTRSSYTESKTSELLDNLGAFFAFSNAQFEEARREGVDYVRAAHGMLCPRDNVEKLFKGLANIQREGIKRDLAENGKRGIIHRELANHDAQITSDIDDTADAVAAYGITRAEIMAEWPSFFQHCVENDFF